jgi:excinuclease ABC subunit C
MPVSEHLKEQVANLPDVPGVYRYFDKAGHLIYVGKAKSLKKRVSSYFSKSYNQWDRKTARLVSQIERVEFTVVDTEYDALLLENSLIKQHQPKYNVMLKDDKSYPFIVITHERFPKIFSTRRVVPGLGQYFGPYASVRTINALLELIHKLFTFRTCSLQLSKENIENEKFKVCLEYHLGNCKGPCENKQTEENYLEEIEQARQILKGRLGIAKQFFKQQMHDWAAQLEFEKAQWAKQKLERIEQFQADSVMVNPELGDLDVFAMSEHENSVFVNYLQVVEGNVCNTFTIELQRRLDESAEELLVLAMIELRQKFMSNHSLIVCNLPVEFPQPGIEVHVPQRGDKRKLLELSLKNALFFKKEKINKAIEMGAETRSDRLLARMQSDLRLSHLPKRIECFDNSNIQGTNPVAAMVCFLDGKPAKKEYRHFHIKTVVGPDDFASMFEIVTRRYKRRLEEKEPLPDLIVIDGGKGQLGMACEALKQLGIYGEVPIIGIAKRLEEIYYPDDPIPLHLEKKSETLRVIQHIRDEAHRFAITFHRDTRSKKSLQTALSGVKGLGPKTLNLVYKNFKSAQSISPDDGPKLEELIGKAKTEILLKYLFGND